MKPHPLLLAILPAGAVQASDAKTNPETADAPFNQKVLRTARAFEDGGGNNNQWTGSGTPVEICHGEARILAEGTGGAYCSGFTFAVAMKVAEETGLLRGKSIEAVRPFPLSRFFPTGGFTTSQTGAN